MTINSFEKQAQKQAAENAKQVYPKRLRNHRNEIVEATDLRHEQQLRGRGYNEEVYAPLAAPAAESQADGFSEPLKDEDGEGSE